jgi:pyruvate dehydrogenase E1 component alpha subunit
VSWYRSSGGQRSEGDEDGEDEGGAAVGGDTVGERRQEVDEEGTGSIGHVEDIETGIRTEGGLDGLSRERLQELLYQMLLGRRFEEKTAEAYAIGKIGGFCHLYIGQEAVTVGALEPLRPDDYVISAYREHVQALVKGITPRAVMAELYGRSDGCAGGKGGSMHLYSAEHNFMGGWGIVGGQIPLATGFGWAIKYRGEDRVCICFMGEAAVNQGAFHESLNMAALWKLPVIFIVENNRFGMGTAWERASSLYDISQKATAYDMPAAVADGMDVLHMREGCGRGRGAGAHGQARRRSSRPAATVSWATPCPTPCTASTARRKRSRSTRRRTRSDASSTSCWKRIC